MNQLGDLLFSLPTIKATKDELSAQIYCIVPSSLSSLLIASKLIDGHFSKDDSFLKTLKNIKKENFNKAVLFSESTSSLLIAFFSNIQERFGFETAGLNFLLTKRVIRKGVPSLFNNKNLGTALGLKNIKNDYCEILKIPKQNFDNVEEWLKTNSISDKKIIAISVGSSKKRQNKKLDERKWIEVINFLSEKNLICVLVGAKWEKSELERIAKQCRAEPKIFAGENGILDNAAFFQKCSLFVGIDSGAMHLAAAVGLKCIVVFGNTDPNQIGPLPFEKHIIIKKESIKQIKAEEIVEQVCKIL
jgi:ADP-heptose:LPS heptosyltransferase